MKTRKLFLLAIALVLAIGLVACRRDNTPGSVDEPDIEGDYGYAADDYNDDDDDVVEGPGHATSAGGITTGERLATILSGDNPERAWVAGLGGDIVMEGPLYLEGEAQRHSANEWSGVSARKIGFYQREDINGARRVPVGAWSLTAEEGIYVNSPQAFFISDGPFLAHVYADVYVNIPYFRLSGVKIHGDVIFETQEYMDTAIWQMWDPDAAVIQEGDNDDYDTDFVLYQSNSGFETYAPLNSSDASANISNTDPQNLVTGEIRVAE